jgi:hypothetical protein
MDSRKFIWNKVETDLSRIQQLSQEHYDENWEFRSWLKEKAPDNIDGIVKALSQKYFALIDCTECANCCRSLQTELKKSELHTVTKTLGQSIKSIRETIYVRRQGASALPDAEREALFHLRDQTGGLPVVSSPRTTKLYIPADWRD